jgi:hypothetical protein
MLSVAITSIRLSVVVLLNELFLFFRLFLWRYKLNICQRWINWELQEFAVTEFPFDADVERQMFDRILLILLLLSMFLLTFAASGD